jgi:hypothetical protein
MYKEPKLVHTAELNGWSIEKPSHRKKKKYFTTG